MVSSDSPESVGGGGDLHLVLFQANLDSAGALIGELSDALNGVHQLFAADNDALVVVRGSTAS